MRSSGILMAVSSLPSPWGIGCFSDSAYRFVDMLARAGQRYWQLLPVGPTGYGDSPYQPFSAFAGNPYFIDLDTLKKDGLLKEEDYAGLDFGQDPEQVDYEKLYNNRYPVLRKAFRVFSDRGLDQEPPYLEFIRAQSDWLEDYCLFMAVKKQFGQSSWLDWDDDIRLRRSDALERYREICEPEMAFFRFLQYEFMKQWTALKSYANSRNIRIIGDIPIYVALDSSECWAMPPLFQFDEDRRPSRIAGCPPDAFAADGQLWGNPLYDWQYHEKTGFAWWIRRLKRCFELYDVVRVDHFRGFDAYFSIPYGAATAAGGRWEEGPGMKLFHAVRRQLGDVPIIAEDLGYLTQSVIDLVKESGYPGMKVMEFAFDSREAGDYMPYRYEANSVVYTGTHDNQTLAAWYDELTAQDRAVVDDYLMLEGRDRAQIVWSLIRLTLGTVSDTAVIPMQDYLGLGAQARMNQPATQGKNWKWRMKDGAFTQQLADQIRHLNRLYGREN